MRLVSLMSLKATDSDSSNSAHYLPNKNSLSLAELSEIADSLNTIAKNFGKVRERAELQMPPLSKEQQALVLSEPTHPKNLIGQYAVRAKPVIRWHPNRHDPQTGMMLNTCHDIPRPDRSFMAQPVTIEGWNEDGTLQITTHYRNFTPKTKLIESDYVDENWIAVDKNFRALSHGLKECKDFEAAYTPSLPDTCLNGLARAQCGLAAQSLRRKIADVRL